MDTQHAEVHRDTVVAGVPSPPWVKWRGRVFVRELSPPVTDRRAIQYLEAPMLELDAGERQKAPNVSVVIGGRELDDGQRITLWLALQDFHGDLSDSDFSRDLGVELAETYRAQIRAVISLFGPSIGVPRRIA